MFSLFTSIDQVAVTWTKKENNNKKQTKNKQNRKLQKNGKLK